MEAIRPEKEPHWYDTAKRRPPYLPLYTAALQYLKDVPRNEIIFDLGCGQGPMAKVLFEAGHHAYFGIDFSKALLASARELVPAATFINADLRTPSTHQIYRAGRVFLLLEVLEHLTHDQILLATIPPGTKVIFSVPNFLSNSHVRSFKDSQTAIARYNNLLYFHDTIIFPMRGHNRIFLFNTTRRIPVPP